MGFRPHRQIDLTKIFNLCYERLIEVLSQIVKHLPGSLLSVHQDSMVLSGTFHSFPNPKEKNRKA